METHRTLERHDGRRASKRCSACGQRYTGEAAFCPLDGTRLEAAPYDPAGDPMVGATVDGRYEVVSLLGEGGMGQVYEVKHVALGRRFAMKVLRRDLARDEELAGRFIQEAKATASVSHPNVVEITDFGRLPDGAPYFVMELLQGETLGHVIKAGGPVPAGRAVRILKQVARALGAAHAAGVVHRDLKPDNVFLVGGFSGGTTSDDARVVDFGAAKIIGASRMTRHGIVFGTPHYMSPEQASGLSVDHRADIYALGVIMYEMFTGRVPFEADTYMGVLTQHMFVQPVPPSEACPAARALGALEQITLVCLAKKPEDRYESMEALAEALDEVVQVRSDGRVQIAARAPSNRPPARVGFRMADELEPPTLAEMRVAIDSVLPPRRVVPWGWILFLGGVLVAAMGLWALLDHPPAASVEPPDSASAHASPAPPLPVLDLPATPAPAPAPSPSAVLAPPSVPAAEAVPPLLSVRTPPVAARPPTAATSGASAQRSSKSPAASTGLDDVGDPFANARAK